MQNPMFLPSIAVALYDRALKSAQQGQTCNVIMLCTASVEAFINEYLELGTRLIENDKLQRANIEKIKQLIDYKENSFHILMPFILKK
ncbi:hypothetical protein [Acinetobacter tianfuensis]|uniref:Uncharacterized protein n=1 Tax=Acinetobacter tianfuensis TaxID=2419603 RepID=A0A3A8EZ47_9GAMM|nr:hypothetical protein [Acinetobacter tianfuensis]RKG33723.1 hypothetical protein D7V32_02675 [Acinetobacter tianfuensis]